MEDDLESQDLKDESEKRGKDDIGRRNTEDDSERREDMKDDSGRRKDLEDDPGRRSTEEVPERPEDIENDPRGQEDLEDIPGIRNKEEDPERREDMKDDPGRREDLEDDPGRRSTEEVPERREGMEDDPGKREDTEDHSVGPAEEDESKRQKGKDQPVENELDSSEEAGEPESKGRRKKKKFSIITFFNEEPNQKDYETDDEHERNKSPGSLKKKLLALENELSVESIQKTTSKVFHPSEGRKDSDSKVKIVESKTKRKRVYMSSTMTAVFIVSASTGSTLPKLPHQLKESSWFGVYFILLLGMNTLYAGLCNGWCWSLMEEIWPEHVEYTRNPYQHMGNRAVGKWMGYVVVFLIDLSVMGYCSNYILLFAESLNQVLGPYIRNCYLMILTVVVLYPFSFFDSYRDIKFIGVCDITLSILFTFLVILCFFFDDWTRKQFRYSVTSLERAAMAFSGMSFSYGIGGVLPSIMIDMADRSKFTEACVTASLIILGLYTILPILGYAAYGDTTPKHILDHFLLSKSMRTYGMILDFMQAFQLLMSTILSMVPIYHSFEALAKCPDEFCTRRVVVRTLTLSFLGVLTLGMPYLSVYMDILGATSINLLTFLFPPIFYLLLKRKQKSKFLKRKSNVKEGIVVTETILLGIVILVAAVYAFIKEFHTMIPESLSCFINMSRPAIEEIRKKLDVSALKHL